MAMLSDMGVPIETVNFHLWQPCNMRCRFCFATFRDVRNSVLPEGHLPEQDARRVVALLAEAGFTKITFAGGEPLLCPWIADLIRLAKSCGLTTALVTNGSLLSTQKLEDLGGALDWATISVDSVSAMTLNTIGRVTAGTPADECHYLSLCHRIKEAGVHLKINTVVTAANRFEDLTSFIIAARPERWKILQALPVSGQNSGKVESLLITPEQFEQFVRRSVRVETHGITVVPEDNHAMRGSYAMLDPAGRFFDAVGHGYTYSKSVLQVGVARAIAQVRIDRAKFLARGGLY
ncbi:viperin family antiviral radical SAM protein [Nonomuraea turcica]|uniref:viperin family antiviral radical SAM protein n=1 Tax=Nonomuraea sp. G32 TaxID=3067274 RepID=UPI00273A75C7|nr:viperin family antiviral radical SAM protein [Nonomuraea sp. G32]MDP4510696.1 viperin family antiviral radical SAM protein [Nonomuraea sp. G32]